MLQGFVSQLIALLIDSDDRRNTCLAETLLTYLECGHNTTQTAARLHIHANTLRQHLDRISQLVPHWREPERTFDVHLALRLHALRARLSANEG